jgi:cytochrome c
MKMMPNSRPLLFALAAAGLLFAAQPASAAFDAEEAKALFKDNDCNKCHAPEKSKKGPSLKDIAKKYKDKPDSDAKVLEHMTSGKKVKLDDGSEEDHKVINTKDPKVRKNLIDWILSH